MKFNTIALIINILINFEVFINNDDYVFLDKNKDEDHLISYNDVEQLNKASNILNYDNYNYNNSLNNINKCDNRNLKYLNLNFFKYPKNNIKNKYCNETTLTCCPISNFFQFKNNWRYNYNNKITKIYEYYEYYNFGLLDNLSNIIETISHININKYNYFCRKIINTIIDIKNDNLKGKIENIKNNYYKMINFNTINLKSFYCFICDYNLNKYINNDNKTITISNNFCKLIVTETIDFYLDAHTFLNKLWNSLSLFNSCYAQFETNKIKNNKSYLNIDDITDIKLCKESPDNNFFYCKRYCKKYKLFTVNELIFKNIYKISKIWKIFKQKLKHIELKYNLKIINKKYNLKNNLYTFIKYPSNYDINTQVFKYKNIAYSILLYKTKIDENGVYIDNNFVKTNNLKLDYEQYNRKLDNIFNNIYTPITKKSYKNDEIFP